MKNLNIMVSRHSAFYSPLIACIAGDFLNSEGIEATYNIVKDGGNSAMEVGNGNMDVAQAAVSASWGPLEKGENLFVSKKLSEPTVISDLSQYLLNFSSNFPIYYAVLSIVLVIFIGAIFSYVREYIHYLKIEFSNKKKVN